MDVVDVVGQVGVVKRLGLQATAAALATARPRHLEHPAGHRDVEAVSAEFLDRSERYFDSRGSAFFRAKQAEARIKIHRLHPVLPPQPHQLGPLVRSDTFDTVALDVVELHPPTQTRPGDPEICRDLRDPACPLSERARLLDS